MHLALLQKFAFVISIGAVGCSGSDESSTVGGSGGAFVVGGATAVGGSPSSSNVVSGVGGTVPGSVVLPAAGGANPASSTTSSGSSVSAGTCTEANKTLTENDTGQHCGYTYEYWKDNGTGSLVLKADGFSVDWSNINNLLGRKGIRPGSENLVVTYEADYRPNGNSYLCVYGWTKNPLIEYYIVDSWGSWRPPGGTAVGSVESDGGTYDIYKTTRTNQPSIEGTKTFSQFWSVRQTKRTSGNITVGNHFKAWAGQGLTLGTFYEVSMTVEGYQSSGTADVKMSIK
jgi:endo-1,4-beta-xylanase